MINRNSILLISKSTMCMEYSTKHIFFCMGAFFIKYMKLLIALVQKGVFLITKKILNIIF